MIVSPLDVSEEGGRVSQPPDHHLRQGLPQPGPLGQDGGSEGKPSCDSSRSTFPATLQSSGGNIALLIFQQRNVRKNSYK